MTAFLIHNMAPLMFAALVVVMLLGYPVAFALAAVGIVFGLLGIELGLLQATLFQALPERIWGVMSNDTLLAVPFFTFMGLILERSGMAEDLLDTIGQLFGADARRPRLRGDLRRRAARGDDRRRRGLGDLDGPHLAADHAALRLRPALRLGRDRRVRHARADHPAVARAHHHGRPARQVGRRHVRGRVHSRLRADRPLRRLYARRLRVQARPGRRRCRPKRARSGSRTARAAAARCSCCSSFR